MKQAIFAVLVLVGLASCNHYTETGAGEVTVVRKGSTFRTEGGGVDSISYMAGTHKVGTFSMDVKAFNLAYTPRLVIIKDLSVMMKSMKNQAMDWTLSLAYSTDPRSMPKIFANFKSSDVEIEKLFREISMSYLTDLNIVVSVENDIQVKSDLDDQNAVADTLLQLMRQAFSQRFPEFKNDFFFAGVSIGNYTWPPDLIRSFELVAAERYKTEKKKYESQVKNLKADLKTLDSEADLAAFSREGTNVSNEVLQYYSYDLLKDAMRDKNTKTTLYIPMDNYGNILWFQSKVLTERSITQQDSSTHKTEN